MASASSHRYTTQQFTSGKETIALIKKSPEAMMGKPLLALLSFSLMIYLPLFIKTPDGDPYLVLRDKDRWDQATYTNPYHALMTRVSAFTGPKEESVTVFARQDSHGNMYFSDKSDSSTFHKNQAYEVRNQFSGRFSFPKHWVWATMLAVWILFYIIFRVLTWAVMHQYEKWHDPDRPAPVKRSSTHSGKTAREKNTAETSHKPGASPFHILGVREDASLEEIKAAYRKKIKAYHPDRVAHLGAELQEIAEKKSSEINRAYEALQSRWIS